MNDQIGAANQLDIGMIIAAPTKDKDWLKKCAIMGLLMLIPVVGQLNLYGWMTAIAQRRLAAGPDLDTLPEAGLHYLGQGWKFFLAYAPLWAIGALLFTVGAGVAGAGFYLASQSGDAAENMRNNIVLGVLTLGIMGGGVLGLAIIVAGPAMMFLHMVDGEPWAFVEFKKVGQVMPRGGTQYFLLFLVGLIASMIGQAGAMAFGVSIIVTLPFGQAVVAISMAEYARLLSPMKAGFPMDGSSGGASGQPFGIKL